ncbi:MAG TPA: hypothetical protein VMQ44_02640 [Candidatus Saccharimonadales bacterium]|nr:hypothetical protein [Candidatus Saccharimonadales bacterium]
MDDKALVKRLNEIDDRLYGIENKLTDFRDEILTSLDRQLVILQRLDQEMLVATHRTDMLEAA